MFNIWGYFDLNTKGLSHCCKYLGAMALVNYELIKSMQEVQLDSQIGMEQMQWISGTTMACTVGLIEKFNFHYMTRL